MSDQVTESIRWLEGAIELSRGQLREDVFLFLSRITPLVNVDLLIQDESRRTLLTWRHDEFYGPGWHVPGGIIRFHEHSASRIRLVAKEELGATVSFDAQPIRVLESIVPGRLNRGHFVSLLYRCRLTDGPLSSIQHLGGTPRPGQWRWHDARPDDLIREQWTYADLME